MDLNDLLNKTPSHKRTSSKAENLNVNQPAPKLARGDGPRTNPTALASMAPSTSPAQGNVEQRLQGVWVVLSLSSDPGDYYTTKTIAGVYASREDAKARVDEERSNYVEDDIIDPEHLHEDEGGMGWSWDDGDSEMIGFSMEFHKIIRPKPESQPTTPSSEPTK